MAGYHLSFNSSSSDDDRPIPWQRNSQLKHYKAKRTLTLQALYSASVLPADQSIWLFVEDIRLLKEVGRVKEYEGRTEELVGRLEDWRTETARSLDISLVPYRAALPGYRPGFCLFDWLWSLLRCHFHQFPPPFFSSPVHLSHFRCSFSPLLTYLKTHFPAYNPLLCFSELDLALIYPERLTWDLERYLAGPASYQALCSAAGLHSPGDLFEPDLSSVLIRYLTSLDFTLLAKAAKVSLRNPVCSSPGCSLVRKLKLLVMDLGYDCDYCSPFEGTALHVFMRKLGDCIQTKKPQKYQELCTLVLGFFASRYIHFHVRFRDKTAWEEFQQEWSADLSGFESAYRAAARRVDVFKVLWVVSRAGSPSLPLSLIREVVKVI